MKEHEQFIEHYSEFCDTITDVEILLPHFVQEKIISADDCEDINNAVKLREKIQKLMIHILHLLECGDTEGFYIMLKIMEKHGNPDTKKLAEKIRNIISKLSTRATRYIHTYVLAYFYSYSYIIYIYVCVYTITLCNGT